MIRANLLPRAKDTVGALGIDVDGESLRQILFGLLVVVLVAVAGTGIETARLHRFAVAVADAETALADRSGERAEARALALHVARYQEIAREATAVRFSGATAALAIARIGNTVPVGVWLESIGQSPSGVELSGGSRTLDGVGAAIQGLSNAPARRAALVSIDTNQRGLRFTARLPLTSSDARP